MAGVGVCLFRRPRPCLDDLGVDADPSLAECLLVAGEPVLDGAEGRHLAEEPDAFKTASYKVAHYLWGALIVSGTHDVLVFDAP